MQNGTYTDTITLRVCKDAQCNSQLRGSPATITATYTVSGTGTATATIDRTNISLKVGGSDSTSRMETAQIALSPAPAMPVFVSVSNSFNAIRSTSYRSLGTEAAAVDIQFAPGSQLVTSVYNDIVNVRVCYDTSCVREVAGSPFTISTTLEVTLVPEPGLTPLSVQSRVALPHNVIDAEYSKALNQIVMVGNYPVSALYVYDVATATEQKQLLNKPPTSVSVAPNGMTAAVGHDALISIVNLTTVGQPGAAAPILLNISADIFDVVLDGRGYVHGFPRTDQWVNPHSINIATNTEQLGSWLLYAGSRARLHPSGDFIYTADNGLSPSDIAKWDITTGVATRLYDSPYHGDYGMCGNVWFNESGSAIYTACGNSFSSSTVQAQDMVYAGKMALSQSNYYGFQIDSLSQSAARNEIALIESESYSCWIVPGNSPCYTHLAVYESQFLNRLSVFSIPPVTVSGIDYGQRGLFVFYSASGAQKYLVSKLAGSPNPDAEYYLSVVN
jgi:hypothetical protein